MKIVLTIIALFLFSPALVSAGDNGTVQDRKALITELSLKKGVPAEIVKAIAYQETGMRQFDDNGKPIMNANEDGGIGIMQVTMNAAEIEQKGIDVQRLSNDMAYNIEIGIEQLIEKKLWSGNRIPAFSTGSMNSSLEDWYFAVMAYNGLEQRNDPARSASTYQDRVYQIIESRSLLKTNPPSSFAVSYNENGNIMRFDESQRVVPFHERLMTETTLTFKPGQRVFTFNPSRAAINLRSEPNTSSTRTTIPHAYPLEIVSGPLYDNNPDHHFAFFEVKRLDTNETGFIASSYLRKGEISIFPDISSSNHEMREAVALLESRNALNGYADGRFGTNRPLQRLHAAVILVNELGLTMPSGYKVKATDHGDHSAIQIAEAHGLLTPYADGKIRPRDAFRRSQMAIVLNRVYGDRFEEPTEKTRFTDIDESFESYDVINRLAFNGVTRVEDAFRPNEAIRRGQFALFLNRVDELLFEN